MFQVQELKDEAYCQILKQLKDHKDPIRCLRVWSFFGIIASCFAPCQRLLYSILHYLFFEIKNNKDPKILQHANYVFVRLYKTYELKRIHIPSEEELIHIEAMRPITIQVNFFNGTSTTTEIESYTSVREVKNKVMKKLEFNASKAPYYCLYEICNKKEKVEERFLEDSEKIADMLSLWELGSKSLTEKSESVEFKLFLKIFVYYPYTESDNDTITVVYTQATYDVYTGKYQLKEDETITLAAIQLLVEYATNQDSAHMNLQKSLEKYVPHNQYNINPSDYWVQKIMELYSGLQSKTKLEAKLTYIEQLKQSPLWEAHQFDAKVFIIFYQILLYS